MPTLTFTCKECEKSAAVSAYITCDFQDGKCNTTEVSFRAYIPKEWERGGLERCKECHEKWVTKMSPVWKAESEASQLSITAKFKRLFAEDRKALIGELRNFGPIGDTKQLQKMDALIACLGD